MNKELFTYGEISIEYLVVGEGHDTIVCLHGFGRSAEDYLIFQSLLQPHQRLVAINLLSHGKSSFPSKRISSDPITKEEWTEVIQWLLASMEIDSFHLMGYSMGGRLAMVLAETMAPCIKSLVLIAPDGLKIKWIYRFVSETKTGRRLYRRIIENPKELFNLVDFLAAIRVLHPKIKRFVHGQLETRDKRQLVYDAWLIHRKLFPRLPGVAHNIEAYHIRFLLIFGRYDRVIPARDSNRLLRFFSKPKPPVLLNLGHRLLHPETLKYMSDNNGWMPAAE